MTEDDLAAKESVKAVQRDLITVSENRQIQTVYDWEHCATGSLRQTLEATPPGLF